MFWIFLLFALVIIYKILIINQDYHIMAFFAKRIKTIDRKPLDCVAPEAKGKSIFGNTFDTLGMNNAEVFEFMRKTAKDWKRSYVQYAGGLTIYNVIVAEDAQIVLTNPKLTVKGMVYNNLHPLLRTGLLTSNERKWHLRRQLLRPAFTFEVMEDFIEVFKKESERFLDTLNGHVTGEISLTELIPTFTLNCACETALGVDLEKQLDGNLYRKSFTKSEDVLFNRINNPFFVNDRSFFSFAPPKHLEDLEIIHEFSNRHIIERRKALAHNESADNTDLEESDNNRSSNNKSYAVVDTLLSAEKNNEIDHTGICEEVDTFMYEAFNTTSIGIIFTLMNLALYPELQERCYQEMIEQLDILSGINIYSLDKLKYLHCFIKETLRLYPPVPTITREAISDTPLVNDLILPKGTQVLIHIFDIQRNAMYFPNPEIFDPEHFSPDNCLKHHTYSYLPFSAGQRNCMGRKFAMLEMKTLIVHILLNYKLLPITNPKDLSFSTGIVLRTKDNIEVKLVERDEAENTNDSIVLSPLL